MRWVTCIRFMICPSSVQAIAIHDTMPLPGQHHLQPRLPCTRLVRDIGQRSHQQDTPIPTCLQASRRGRKESVVLRSQNIPGAVMCVAHATLIIRLWYLCSIDTLQSVFAIQSTTLSLLLYSWSHSLLSLWSITGLFLGATVNYTRIMLLLTTSCLHNFLHMWLPCPYELRLAR